MVIEMSYNRFYFGKRYNETCLKIS